jgi:hypothetical protein
MENENYLERLVNKLGAARLTEVFRLFAASLSLEVTLVDKGVKEKRVEFSKALLDEIIRKETINFEHIMTEDVF